jgi:hypothetical protein
MMLTPVCWAAPFSTSLSGRRVLRRILLAGTVAAPEGSGGGAAGGSTAVAALGKLARRVRGRGGGSSW